MANLRSGLLLALAAVVTAFATLPECVEAHRRGATAPRASRMPLSALNDASRPGVHNCTEKFFAQRLDHFNFPPLSDPGVTTPLTYPQRYFTCLEHQFQPNGTIFYYTGNEADVELFVNMTGLMWQNALEWGNVMLVFAEHRYFGKSLPFPDDAMPTGDKLKYLTTDQALADYANHINHLRVSLNSPSSPVIGFGGSYGGMLCAWLRIKYPSALDGCIAGSAPIVNFEHMVPPYPADAFAAIETLDASTAGGANDICKNNVRQVWQDMLAIAGETGGMSQLQHALQLCTPPTDTNDVWNLINGASNAIGMMAMSSYPYPSAYLLLGGKGMLPAYPMRVGCAFMNRTFVKPIDRVAAFGNFANVYFNATQDLTCINASAAVNYATEVVDYLWGYLACTTMFMPFATTGVNDMFWAAPWNATAQKVSCFETYGVWPQADWIQVQYGGRGVSAWGSNIVFSNGQLDPWRPGGIQHVDKGSGDRNMRTVIIPDVGHHIDLMWNDPRDTVAIRGARAMEASMIKRWIAGKQP